MFAVAFILTVVLAAMVGLWVGLEVSGAEVTARELLLVTFVIALFVLISGAVFAHLARVLGAYNV